MIPVHGIRCVNDEMLDNFEWRENDVIIMRHWVLWDKLFYILSWPSLLRKPDFKNFMLKFTLNKLKSCMEKEDLR